MTDRTPPPTGLHLDPWESSTWEGHARWQIARSLAATPLERLLWLEAAIELAWEAGAIRARVPEARDSAG